MSHTIVSYDNGVYIFECPHCKDLVMVSERQVNCKIFRHAQYKSNYRQINPHATKEYCDQVVSQNLVYGCAKPFILVYGSDNKIQFADICDYI